MTAYLVERGLLPGDVPGDSFYDALMRARLCQADLVLCCLRINTPASLRVAERLVGRPVTRCPPCLRLAHSRRARRRCGPDDRVVIAVREPRPVERGRARLLKCDLYRRLALARVGLSVKQLLARGLRRRDLLIAQRRGYLRLAAPRAATA